MGCRKIWSHAPHILIAHDTRVSGLWVTSALQTGLLTYTIHLDLADVLPTPALVQIFKQSLAQYQCGIMISASHNPVS